MRDVPTSDDDLGVALAYSAVDADCVRRQPGCGKRSRRAGRTGDASTAPTAGRARRRLLVRKVLVLHPANLVVQGHLPESIGDGDGDSELRPARTTLRAAESYLGSVITFRSVAAYSLSIALSPWAGVIVSEAELLALGATRLGIGARAMWRPTSRPRVSDALSVESTDAIEAGAVQATCASSPGVTALATPTPSADSSAAGTTSRANHNANVGRIARRGRARSTCSHSPENETKPLSL
jgi:hypothetical protein